MGGEAVRKILLDVEEKARALDSSIIRVKAYVSQRMQQVQFAGSDGTDAGTIETDLLSLTHLAVLQHHAADVGVLYKDVGINPL